MSFCPQCGHDNPPGARACASCTAPLEVRCPYCAALIDTVSNFCPHCGKKLVANRLAPADSRSASRNGTSHRYSSPPSLSLGTTDDILEGERRPVTIISVDASNFTASAHHMDPEDVYAMLNECLSQLTQVVHQFEGTIDKYTGDGLVALFGAPVAHENDPELAIRTALEMQLALVPLREDIRRRYGVDLQLRIGVHHGEVIAGQIGNDLHRTYTVLGNALHLAIELQQSAQPGTVVASSAVFRATRSLFRYQALDPIAIDGASKPIQAYCLLGLRQHSDNARGIQGLRASMIGRGRQFTALRHVIDDLADRQQGSLVFVSGEAGVGKSRLTQELKPYLEVRAIPFIEGACLPYTQHTGYWIVAELLRSYFGLCEGDSETIRQQKLTHRTAWPEELAANILPYVGRLLNVDLGIAAWEERVRHLDGAQLKRQTFAAVRRLLTWEARQKPFVVVFEDMHWADQTSMELIGSLIDLIDEYPIVFYFISRTAEPIVRLHELAESKPGRPHLELELGSLTASESRQLIRELLNQPTLPERWIETLIRTADGNPFYLEELIRMLIDRGVIEQSGSVWQLGVQWQLPDQTTEAMVIQQLEVPDTLQGLILARFDTLPARLRRTLRCAAALGRSTSPRLLAALTGLSDKDLGEQVRALATRGFFLIPIRNRRSRNHESTISFKHVLTQEAVYGTLLKRHRRQLHQAAGEAIESLYAEHLDDQVEVLAYHFTECEQTARALPYMLRAGTRLADRYANQDALRFYRQAELALQDLSGDHLSEERLFHLGLARVLTRIGQYGEALDHYHRALAKIHDSIEIAEVHIDLADLHSRQGDFKAANLWLEQAQHDLGEIDLSQELIQQAPLRATGSGRAADENRVAASPESLTSSKRLVAQIRLLERRAWIALRTGQLDEALRLAERGLEFAEPSGHYGLMAALHNTTGICHHQFGHRDQAAELMERSLRLRERIGDVLGAAQASNNLGLMRLDSDPQTASSYIRRALNIAQDIGDVQNTASFHNNLGLAYSMMGRLSSALDHFQSSLHMRTRLQDNWGITQCYINLAQIYLHLERWGEAEDHLKHSLDLAEKFGYRDHQAEATLNMAVCRMGQKDYLAAHFWASRALAEAEWLHSPEHLAKADRLLGMIARHLNEWNRSFEHLSRAATTFVDQGMHMDHAQTILELGLAYKDHGKYLNGMCDPEIKRNAQAHLQHAVERLRTLHADRDLARAEAALAELG